MTPTLYTVQRISRTDKLYGAVHGSVDADKTVCGYSINGSWYINDNTFTGTITCRGCKALIKDDPLQVKDNG